MYISGDTVDFLSSVHPPTTFILPSESQVCSDNLSHLHGLVLWREGLTLLLAPPVNLESSKPIMVVFPAGDWLRHVKEL